MAARAVATRLPRLLYVGDVPVESSYHGSALIYRLLQNYPAGALRIIETGHGSSLTERRLERVEYRAVQLGRARWLNTRFGKHFSAWLSRTTALRHSFIVKQLGAFSPEAVLSVVHGYGWLAAARFAHRRGLPLHLILHDDWPQVAKLPRYGAAWLDRTCGRIYRQAASRLCVSPFMVEDYAARYGVPGTVLYPSRAADCPDFAAPPERLKQTGRSLNFVFAGTINSPGYARALQALADGASAGGNRLVIYGPAKPTDVAAVGLNRPSVEFRGLIKSSELIQRLRDEADVLFVPMSFAEEDRRNMMQGFPSKLTDCTAVGVPLLIYGPEYCSAVRWARENPGVAEVVDSEDAGKLAVAVNRLAADPALRMDLGARALSVGQTFFSHASALCSFHAVLRSER